MNDCHSTYGLTSAIIGGLNTVSYQKVGFNDVMERTVESGSFSYSSVPGIVYKTRALVMTFSYQFIEIKETILC